MLANGKRSRALPGVQDTASQFVQLTWLFTTQPELLRVGRAIEVPLALPRACRPLGLRRGGRGDAWRRRSGALDTFHLKPRREPAAAAAT